MRRIVACLLVLLLLVGCGSNTTEQDEESNVLRVGMECDYAPFNWSTVEAGEFSQPLNEVDYCDGYDVVMATRIADELGMEVQIVKLEWDALIPALTNGEIDLIIAGMTDTPLRRDSGVAFTTPYYESQMTVIVKADSDLVNITDIQELSGRIVEGQLGTTYDEVIDQINGVIHADAKEAYPAMIPDLQYGIVDAITAELPVAIGICSANPDLAYVTFAEGKGFVVDTSVSIGVDARNEELLIKVQGVLDGISEDERLQILLAATDRQPAND